VFALLLPRMLQAQEMRAKAEQCERVAAGASDRLTAYTFRELATQWREMADQVEKLEHAPIYQTIRDRRTD